MVLVAALLSALAIPTAFAKLSFSAGFSSDAVLQRSTGSEGARVYGFTDTGAAVAVTVNGNDGAGRSVKYQVSATVTPWTGGADVHPDTPPPPPHGDFVWAASLKPASAGGALTISASNGGDNGTATIERVTHGDVFFCSGQSNMALETYYTFSADSLKAEIAAGKYANLRHFMNGGMGLHYEATTPQWVTTQNSAGTAPPNADPFVWHNVSASAALPSLDNATKRHSPFAQFAAACMYFGAELIAARETLGDDAEVPVGLIQSAIGGSQIESWMDNETLGLCANESLTGGAIPNDSGALFYGMVCPFVNYSVAGWIWYQGENNVYGDMGNSATGTGYGCELPAMVDLWRRVWRADPSALFGVATLAAGGSEGNGQHMGGMRWSQTANYGVNPNPRMPNSFLAQVYDLGDPWAAKEKGWTGGDPENCSLPDPATGHYGPNCTVWDESKWSPGMQPYASLIRQNAPSGNPGVNFMGGIHPRLKRPVGRRLAVAAASIMHQRANSNEDGTEMTTNTIGVPFTGPTIAGCTYSSGRRSNTGYRRAEHSDIATPSLTLHFNQTLLAGDTLMVQDFNTNMSTWSGVDSLTLMVCGSATPPPPGPPLTCPEKCEAAGHCSVGLISCDQQPSCGQGCEVAAAGASLEKCKSVCKTAGGDGNGNSGCTHKYKNLTLQSCAGCATWQPDQKKPAGLSPYTDCGRPSIGHCIEGCEYAHGAPPAPLFPTANETTCACQSWSKVPCDGGVKGQTGKWPCDPLGPQSGADFWYCEDGPGWKPPLVLRQRARRYREEEAQTRQQALQKETFAATAPKASLLDPGYAVGQPRVPANIFETLWFAAPLKAGAAGDGTVEVDLSGLQEQGRTEIHAIRYAWPLGDDGDTCCPEADVAAGLSVCVPAACPLLAEKSQLPANPFFATIQKGKCACEAPQQCDA